MRSTGLLPGCAAALAVASSVAASDARYRVLLDGAADPAFRPAAERLALLHGVDVERCDLGHPSSVRDLLRAPGGRELPGAAVDHVAFVVDPRSLDMQVAQDLLVALTEVDEDPFVDVAYGFITGRDGPAALRFVERIEAGRGRTPTGNVALFGSWEGPTAPTAQPLSALKALGLTGRQRYVLALDADEARAKVAHEALDALGDVDLALLFSHGHPDRMELCFRGADLRTWRPSLPPCVVVNCACWNGVTGRWWEESAAGSVERVPVPLDDSVALGFLDSGCAAYVAGLDPWHGPLAMRYTMTLLDDGCTIGEAAKDTFDRLTLEFAPGRIAYPPVAQRGQRGEGTENRRRNSAAIVVYGDPAWAPRRAAASHRLRATRTEVDAEGARRLTIALDPLVDGTPGADFMLPQALLVDYHSVRSQDWSKEATLELRRAIDWPEPLAAVPEVRVVSATVRDQKLPCGQPQVAVEHVPSGRRLHVRVPVTVRAFGSMWPIGIATGGATITLEVRPAPGPAS